MRFVRTGLSVLAGFAILASPAVLHAEIDKEAKEKKENKEARPEMDGDEHEKFHEQLVEEGEKTLEEINKLLEQIRNDLGGKQTGAATQAKQKQVVERLDKLIKELGKG